MASDKAWEKIWNDMELGKHDFNLSPVVISAKDRSGKIGTLVLPIDYGTKPSNAIKLSGNSTVYVKVHGTYKERMRSQDT